MSNNTKSVLEQMYEKDRVIITAQLSLDNGHFLQPTGFPDIDFCTYIDAEQNARCLVESEQSMANRLESVCMKSPGEWVEDLIGLPVIEVRDQTSALLATNLTEPHRIASSYVLEGKVAPGNDTKDVKTLLMGALGLTDGGDTWPLGKRDELDKVVFALDPGALLHGFQFVQWKFVGLRQTRLLSARLECKLAENPDVHYGMVKFDLLEPGAQGPLTNKGQSLAAKSRVVPATDGIEATFDIDVRGLKSLGLDELQKKFLLGLALWKIGAFLSNKAAFDARSRQTSPSLRLRADCYLTCGKVTWRATTNASEADVTLDDLIGALPATKPPFKKLIEQSVGLTPFTDAEEAQQSQDNAKGGDEQASGHLIYRVTYKRRSAAVAAPQALQPRDTPTNDGADS